MLYNTITTTEGCNVCLSFTWIVLYINIRDIKNMMLNTYFSILHSSECIFQIVTHDVYQKKKPMG